MIKQVMMLGVVMTGLSLSAAYQKQSEDIDFVSKVRAGLFVRGSMETSMNGFGLDKGTVVGPDAEILFDLYNEGAFSLWAGLGASATPTQEVAKKSLSGSIYYPGLGMLSGNLTEKLKIADGEVRFILEPEYHIEDNWTINGRLGFALGIVHMSGSLSAEGYAYDLYPGQLKYSAKATNTEPVFQGIIGVGTTYMFTEEFGLSCGIEYRATRSVDFDVEGENFGDFNMSGWHVNTGLVYIF